LSDADTIRSLYELLAAGRLEDSAALLDPEIEWDTSEAPTGVRTRGLDGARADLEAMLDAWDEYESVVERLVEAGEVIVVVVVNRGRGRVGGVPIEARRAHVWRLHDGRPVSMRLYLDPADAFAAVGLELSP
jgi:uncharacterized protein